MLDKDEFEKAGLTGKQVINQAISGPLLDDYKKAEGKSLFEALMDELKDIDAPYIPPFSGPILIPADKYEEFKKKFYGKK